MVDTRSLTILLATAALASTGSCLLDEDDFDSRTACRKYCTKMFECDDVEPKGSERRACVSGCRETIGDECGEEHQPAVNDRVMECEDQSCSGFWACMIFEPAPECLDFVED